ncbi:MAG TPA: radical SAM protein [Polyangiaceae bacterium]|jgi:MoaA/NifB/PqqE/SkfB family radical SAM enzyme|nr:radical SAM protein [Polyangiaceae bacterium]
MVGRRAAQGAGRLATHALVQLNLRTHRTWGLPILLFAPTSRCNSRCVSCDFWKTDGANDLRREEVAALCAELPALRTKLVVFTGGEPLVREDVFELADLFLAQGVVLHLLTSGLALERHAEAVAKRFAAVTISLDGHTPTLYRQVRGVDGLGAVERGVQRLKEIAPDLPVRARSTLHKHNFRALPDLIAKAATMGLEQISFLTADVSAEAFSRAAFSRMAPTPSPHSLLLDAGETDEFERVIEKALASHAGAFDEGRVAERGDRLRRLARYYRAHQKRGPFPEVRCNAPWVSAVVESDGTVRPCFFQPAIGNLRAKSLRAWLDEEMVRFRQGLKVSANATCQRCVCSLRLGLRSRLW